MSALVITPPLGPRISTRIRHNYAGELVRILRFKRRGISLLEFQTTQEDAKDRPPIPMVSH